VINKQGNPFGRASERSYEAIMSVMRRKEEESYG
jgi:hypothetical protein